MSLVHRTGVPGRADYRLELHVSRGRLTLVTGASAVFTAGCALMARYPTTDAYADASLLIAGVGLIGSMFFALGVVFGLLRLVQRKPALVVDAVGVHDHASLAAAGTIPWSNISGAHYTNFGSGHTLSIHTYDPRAVIAGLCWPRRLVLAANLRLLSTPVNIPAALFSNGLSTAAFGITIHSNAVHDGRVRSSFDETRT